MTKSLAYGVVAFLAVASAWSIAHAIADDNVAEINLSLYEINRATRTTGQVPTQEELRRLESKSAIATALAPQNGFYWDADARIRFTPRVDGEVTVIDMQGAYRAAQRGTAVSPSSGYKWGSLLYAADQLHSASQLAGGLPELEFALIKAARLASREPQVLRNVVDIGFANWTKLSPAAQSEVKTAIGHFSRREPESVIAIANNRGQLAIACQDKKLFSQSVCSAIRQVSVSTASRQTGVSLNQVLISSLFNHKGVV